MVVTRNLRWEWLREGPARHMVHVDHANGWTLPHHSLCALKTNRNGQRILRRKYSLWAESFGPLQRSRTNRQRRAGARFPAGRPAPPASSALKAGDRAHETNGRGNSMKPQCFPALCEERRTVFWPMLELEPLRAFHVESARAALEPPAGPESDGYRQLL
jgi:hypothetical protein